MEVPRRSAVDAFGGGFVLGLNVLSPTRIVGRRRRYDRHCQHVLPSTGKLRGKSNAYNVLILFGSSNIVSNE